MSGLFFDETGKLSSTRVFGAFCVLLGGLLACLKQPKEASTLVTAGVTLLSAGQGKSALTTLGTGLINAKLEDKTKAQESGQSAQTGGKDGKGIVIQNDI